MSSARHKCLSRMERGRRGGGAVAGASSAAPTELAAAPTPLLLFLYLCCCASLYLYLCWCSTSPAPSLSSCCLAPLNFSLCFMRSACGQLLCFFLLLLLFALPIRHAASEVRSLLASLPAWDNKFSVRHFLPAWVCVCVHVCARLIVVRLQAEAAAAPASSFSFYFFVLSN